MPRSSSSTWCLKRTINLRHHFGDIAMTQTKTIYSVYHVVLLISVIGTGDWEQPILLIVLGYKNPDRSTLASLTDLR